MEGDTTRDIIEGLSDSAVEYVNFLSCELNEAAGSSFMRMHWPAPEDMTHEQLEVIAAEIRSKGWNAEVAPVAAEEDSPVGIKISYDE